MPRTQDHPQATLQAALRAVAGARPVGSTVGGTLAVLILTLLLRLLARTDGTWLLSSDDEYDAEHGYDDDAGASLYALIPRAIGSAPHAIYVEAGLIADWILAGVRNRGMRALPRAIPQPPHTRPVRAPPPPSRLPPGDLEPRSGSRPRSGPAQPHFSIIPTRI